MNQRAKTNLSYPDASDGCTLDKVLHAVAGGVVWLVPPPQKGGQL